MRILILAPTAADAAPFRDPAAKLALELILGCADDTGTVQVDFESRDSALLIVDLAWNQPFAAIVPVGDAAPPVAVRAAGMLGLPSHPPKAADACRDQAALRIRLQALGLNVAEPPTPPILLHTPSSKTASSSLRLTCLMTNRHLRVLAVSDHNHTPRPLTALERPTQQAVANLLQKLARALGLRHGPVIVHINIQPDHMAVTSVSVAYTSEVAGLTFRIPLVDDHISWEELLLRNAIGLDTARVYLA